MLLDSLIEIRNKEVNLFASLLHILHKMVPIIL